MRYRILRVSSLLSVWMLTIVFCFSQAGGAAATIQSLFQEARALKNTGEYGKAIQLYQEILKQDPENYQAIMELAQVYSWNKEYDRSIEYYNRILGKNSRDYDALFGKAQVLSWKGEYGGAEDLYIEVIEAVPDYLDAYLGLANVYLWSYRYDDALDVLKKLEEENPNNQEISKKILDAYYAKGDFKSAKAYYQKIIKLDREYKASPEVMADLCLYTIDIGYLYEHLDIMDDWKSNYLTISYRPNQKFTAVLSANWLDRFNEMDSNFDLGFYTDIAPSLNAYLGLILTPEPDSSSFQRYDIDFVLNIDLVLEARDGTSFLAGLDYSIFDEGVVQVYTAGVEQYLTGKTYFSCQLFHSRDYDGAVSDSYLLKLNFSEENRCSCTFGYAAGSEASWVESRQEIVEVETETFFVILKRWFNPRWGMSINASYADRKNSYLRRSVGGGFFVKI